MPGYYENKIFKALLIMQDEIKKSGISTWCDHIPELQKFITQIVRYNFSQHDSVLCNQCLQESLKYYEPIKNYFSSSVRVQKSLSDLFEIINLEINKKEVVIPLRNKPRKQSLPDIDESKKQGKLILEQWQAKQGCAIAFLSEVEYDSKLPSLLKLPHHAPAETSSFNKLLKRMKLVK